MKYDCDITYIVIENQELLVKKMFNQILNLNEREFSARPLREIAYYVRFS